MDQHRNAGAVGTCKHLQPLLEQALSRGARITDIEQGYSEVRQVVRISVPPPSQEQLAEGLERFESRDPHYRRRPENGVVCRNCRQALAWDR
jgi:hypothetical protein